MVSDANYKESYSNKEAAGMMVCDGWECYLNAEREKQCEQSDL